MNDAPTPRLLDLFSGAGGAAMGYHQAGFDVTGVDIKPQPRYPFKFWQHDALAFLQLDPPQDIASNFDAVHASPPCQRWTTRSSDGWPDLIEPIRMLLNTIGVPYVIENVIGAPLIAPTILCGSMFGLRVRRHRAFETTFPVMTGQCVHGDEIVTVTGGGPSPASFHRPPGGGPDRKPRNVADARDALGIDWPMTRHECNEAIPPAYTHHIGRYLLAELTR